VLEVSHPDAATRAPLRRALSRSSRSIRVGLLGCGRVGQAVAARLVAERPRFDAAGLDLRVVAALVRDVERPRTGPPVPLCDSADRFFAHRNDVVIEALGGVQPALDLVVRALASGAAVVTANKSLMAAHGDELRALARTRRTPLTFEAAVLAGVPFLHALARRPLVASARRIAGIVNATTHFLACAQADGVSWSSALEVAIARGYAEPDSAADVSGRDAAEKLAILLQLAGCQGASPQDFVTVGLDVVTAADFAGAHALGGVIKPVVRASLDPSDPGAWVGPAFLDQSHPWAAFRGVTNVVELSGPGRTPMSFSGPGAGPAVTAATIVDDVLEVLQSGPARGGSVPVPPVASVSRDALAAPPQSEWFLRLGNTARLSIADVAEWLAAHALPAQHLVRLEDVVVARTTTGSWRTVQEVVRRCAALGANALALPVIEGGRDD
jgi:homoserine dehydrogenase